MGETPHRRRESGEAEVNERLTNSRAKRFLSAMRSLQVLGHGDLDEIIRNWDIRRTLEEEALDRSKRDAWQWGQKQTS
jgi:hypothetical protein